MIVLGISLFLGIAEPIKDLFAPKRNNKDNSPLIPRKKQKKVVAKEKPTKPNKVVEYFDKKRMEK